MRALIAPSILLSLLCAGFASRVDAQIGLPWVQLLGVARTLPSLPEIDTEPPIDMRDTLARGRADRKSVEQGKSVAVRVDHGGRRISKNNKHMSLPPTESKQYPTPHHPVSDPTTEQ